MNKYESIVIVSPKVGEEMINETIKKIEDKLKEFNDTNKEHLETEIIGERKLAYEIRKHNSGYYVLFNFEAEPEEIIELERLYRITDEVLKFIVVRKDN